MATQIVNKIEFNNNIYKLQDSDALPLAGGSVTGPVNFGDTVTMEQASVGDLVITGNASSTNNLQVNTINGTDFDIVKNRGVQYIRGTWTAASGTWTGVSQDAQLYDGKQIILYMPYGGSGNATLNLTLAGGGTTGAKNVYFEGTSRFTTHKGQNSQLHLIYHEGIKMSDGTTYSGWWYVANRDTDTISLLRYQNYVLAKTAITANSLIVGDSAGYSRVASGVTFDISYPILWSTAAVNANAQNYANMFICNYNLNIATGAKSGFISTKNKMIYLIVTVNGLTATIDSNIITDTLPSTEDGKVYIALGRLANNSNGATYFILHPTHPMFMYKNGKIIQYTGAETDNLSQIGGRNLLIGTEKKLFQGVSGTLEIPYQLSLYAQSKNVFYIQDETYTISFDYTVSNAGGTVAIKVNNLDGVLLDKGNRYNSSLSQSVTAVKTTYRRTVKISQAQANNAGNASLKIVFSGIASNSTVTVQNVKLEYGNIVTDYTPSPEEIGWEPQLIAPEGDKVQYIGEEVSFNTLEKPNVYIQEFKRAGGTSGASDENSWQGMDTYGKYLFRTKTNGTVYVYDLTEGYQNLSIIDSFQLGSYRTAAGTKWGLTFDTSNHAGVLCFTDKKFNNSDEFPLLLVSDGSGSGDSQIEGKGFCYIQRIQRTGNNFTSTTVGVIYLKWILGTDANNLTDKFFFPWCQWHYYNGYIYTFGHKRRSAGGTTKVFNEHILTKWKPDILTLINQNATNSDSPKVSTFDQSYITNTKTLKWMDNQWHIEYTQDFMQGCRFYNDKIIATFGHGTTERPNKVVIFSLTSATAIATIDLTNTPMVATKTMEGCAIYNNKILLGFTGNVAASMLYSLSFVKNKTGEVTEPLSLATTSTDGLMSAADKTMLDTISSSYVLNPNLQPPILAVDPSMAVFRTIGVIGDSFSAGSIYYPDGTGMSNLYEMSWGKQLGRMFGGYYGGKNVMNYAGGGLTAKRWLHNATSGRGWAKFDADIQPRNTSTGAGGKQKDLYTIAFGINDYREIVTHVGTNYDSTYGWGSINDVVNYTNITDSTASDYYLNSPESFYGIYNRIIRHIKKLSPYSIIIILSYLRNDVAHDSDSAKPVTNGHLEKIAQAFNAFTQTNDNVVYIDVDTDPFFNSDFYKSGAYVGYHPTAIGHAGMAIAMSRLIGKAMRQHPEKFLTIGKIDSPDYLD